MGSERSVTVDIEKLVYGGDGLARNEGKVVLVPFVLPGERVEVQNPRMKSGVSRGTSMRLIEAAQQRIQPRCEYFANCGGCHYQHLDYDYQLEQKQAILRETLARIGGIQYAGEIDSVRSEPWGYRNRIQLHFENGKAGFWKAESHQLCPIDHCYISSPLLNEVIQKLQNMVRRAEWPKFLRSLEIFTNEREVQLHVVESSQPVAIRFFDWCRTLLPHVAENEIDYAAAGETFRISRGSFFQVNRFLIDALVNGVLASSKGNYAVDLYAGVGLFSLALGKRYERVQAVERGSAAFRDLLFNAERSESTIEALHGSAEEALASIQKAPDFLVADPPRAGLGPDATRELLRIKATRMVIVSCDPATLARDLRSLSAEYEIERMTLIDLFPQTYHLETIVHLVKK